MIISDVSEEKKDLIKQVVLQEIRKNRQERHQVYKQRTKRSLLDKINRDPKSQASQQDDHYQSDNVLVLTSEMLNQLISSKIEEMSEKNLEQHNQPPTQPIHHSQCPDHQQEDNQILNILNSPQHLETNISTEDATSKFPLKQANTEDFKNVQISPSNPAITEKDESQEDDMRMDFDQIGLDEPVKKQKKQNTTPKVKETKTSEFSLKDQVIQPAAKAPLTPLKTLQNKKPIPRQNSDDEDMKMNDDEI